jgi:transposase, IS30 family
MGEDGGRPPGWGLTDKQDRFVRLIAQGVNNSEACRMVGVNRRTGTRWRHGRTIRNTAGEPVQYAPVPAPKPSKPRHPRFLSPEERLAIADMRREKLTVRDMAKQLGRSPSTVSRELRRNVDARGRYLPGVADRLAGERLRRHRGRRLGADPKLRKAVCGLLSKRWSPEQVAQELRRLFPDRRDRQLCTESIYQAIYDPELAVARPAKRRRRRRRRTVQGVHRRGRLTAMTMIAQRPAEVEERAQVGHWEGDCIMGAGRRSAIGTLVERRTRYVILIHVPTGRPTGEVIRDGVTAALGNLPAELRRTLT